MYLKYVTATFRVHSFAIAEGFFQTCRMAQQMPLDI